MLGVGAAVPGSIAAKTGPDAVLTSFRDQIELTMDEFCYDCHGYGGDKGGVVLDGWESDDDLLDHELWLRVLRNVRSGIMPPADEAQLDPEQKEAIIHWIKEKAFQLDPLQPDPGRVTVRRLNRVEYRNTIRDLIGVDYDTAIEFPADDTGHGFDNIADVLTISPMLLEKYLDAAQAIIDEAMPSQPLVVAERALPGKRFESTVAIVEPPTPTAVVEGEEAPAPPPSSEVWQAGELAGDARDLLYYSPASLRATHTAEHAGNYEVVLNFRALERYVDNQFDLNKCRIVLKVDGEELLAKEMVREGYGREFSYTFPQQWEAGEHEFLVEIHPLEPAVEQIRQLRIRLDDVVVRGPMAPEHWVPPANYAERFPRPVPESVAERREYARELLTDFTFRAFRRPVGPSTIDRLVDVAIHVSEQPESTFEAGISQAMVAVLASPRFLFREEEAMAAAEGEKYPLVDEYALASRLSYFLWSTMPDQELFNLAEKGALRAHLPEQVKRMLADERSEEFVNNFTGQWLQARDIPNVNISSFVVFLRENPDPEVAKARETFVRLRRIEEEDRTEEQAAELAEARQTFFAFFRQPKPDLNGDVRWAMKRETEMYFDHILREDRSLLELIDSDYTFLNEELAAHYEIPTDDIKGAKMRKVMLPPDSPRGGVLTQGTVLAVTSNPTRTSPVKRGVFILDNILGTPPPPPPPNIPALEDVASEEELAKLSLRETLALHASNKMCASCHSRMDPLGLALENFNAMGRWRDAEMGKPIEPDGELITGQKFSNVQELKQILLTDHREQFLHTLTEKMLTYALGRGMEYYDTETLDQLVAQVEAADARPSALIMGIIESAAFQKTRPPETLLSSTPDESIEETDRLVANRR